MPLVPPVPPVPPVGPAPAARPSRLLLEWTPVPGAAAATLPGLSACAYVDDEGEVGLAGVGRAGEVWNDDVGAPVTGFAVGGGAVLVATAEHVSVVDAGSGDFGLHASAPPPHESVQWVVSPAAVWALVGTRGPARGPWTLLRLPRERWTRDAPSFVEAADRWELPAASGDGAAYQRPTLRAADVAHASVVTLVPDGPDGGYLVRVGTTGPPEEVRHRGGRLPLAVLDTAAGELVTGRSGVVLGGRPLPDLTLAIDPHTRWTPVAGDVLAAGSCPRTSTPTRCSRSASAC